MLVPIGLEELQRCPGDHQDVEDEAAAAAAPSAARISSGPAFRKVCSLNMISSTAAANPVPWARLNSGAAPSPDSDPGQAALGRRV